MSNMIKKIRKNIENNKNGKVPSCCGHKMFLKEDYGYVCDECGKAKSLKIKK